MKKFIIIIILFSFGFIGFKYIKYENHEYKKESIKALKDTEEEINHQLKNNTSNKTSSEKKTEVIKDMVSSRLKDVNPVKANNEDKSFSAGVFAGQYMKQTVAVYDYCKIIGVDVSEFVNKYKKEHKNLYITSNNILINNKVSIEELYKNGKEHIMKDVKNEAKDIRNKLIKSTGDNSVNIKDVCEFYNYISTNEVLFNNIKFSVLMPEVHEILINL